MYNIEYRRIGSGGGWPSTFTDVAGALDSVPTLLQKYSQLRPDGVTVAGHRAGAQLAVWGATRPASAGAKHFRPSRIVSLAGPLNMVAAASGGDHRVTGILGGMPSEAPDRYRTVDPIQHLDAAIPVLAIHGDRDTVMSPDLSRQFVERLTADGGQARLTLLPGQDHGSDLRAGSPDYHRVLELFSGVG